MAVIGTAIGIGATDGKKGDTTTGCGTAGDLTGTGTAATADDASIAVSGWRGIDTTLAIEAGGIATNNHTVL